MKNIIYPLLLAFLFPVFLFADNEVPVEGDWGGDERIRSFVPARPVVYLNDDVLSIYLADPLTGLAVVITDNNGNTVYQDSISTTQLGETHSITLPDVTQEGYTITLFHQRYGFLTGSW